MSDTVVSGKTKILVIGQSTLHWGRVEFGNAGNYYVIEPFFRGLHSVAPHVVIRTTLQMSDSFCVKENVLCLPMNAYYGWTYSDFPKAIYEVISSFILRYTRIPLPKTRYMAEVLKADVVVDMSGDIWGDNADLVGKHRFIIGLCKDILPTFLGTPAVMLAGSPGPFKKGLLKGLARKVFSKFRLVTNRDPISTKLLREDNFDVSRVRDCACPAFLFEGSSVSRGREIFRKERLDVLERPVVGVVVCGWNMLKGPYGRWPRADSEYQIFADAISFMVETLGLHVFLISHSNGFEKDPQFKLIHGRDYQDAKRLYDVCHQGLCMDHVTLQQGIYLPADLKAMIGQMDMLVTGRVHASVAGLSQFIPTVIIDYGHEPKAHKLRGFAEVTGVSEYVADPAEGDDLKQKKEKCWNNRVAYREFLQKKIPQVQALARKNFDLLKNMISQTNTSTPRDSSDS
ncbi:MAG: polysaccharide pyruvyl transferase family protein [Bacteroidia bacterium]|nr:polysaccharide pyruvyl transferase family protein [Bacteroidia bacterium]